MNTTEAKRRIERLASLSEVLGKRMSPESLVLFVEATSSLTAEQFDQGVGKATQESRYMPTPAAFREMAVGMNLLPRASEINAAEAKRWGGKTH